MNAESDFTLFYTQLNMNVVWYYQRENTNFIGKGASIQLAKKALKQWET